MNTMEYETNAHPNTCRISAHVSILCLCRFGSVLHEDASRGEPGAPGGGADAAVSAGG